MFALLLMAVSPQADLQAPQAPTPPSTTPAASAARPSDAAAIRAIFALGECTAHHLPAKAAQVLAMDFTTPEYDMALRKLARADTGCMARGKRAQFGGVLLAGAMAEELLRRDGHELAGRMATDLAAPITARSDSEMIALCTVRAAPRETAALFATEPASEAEKAAVSALSPSLVQCIATGQKARFNRPGLRAILATASFRIVQSGRAPAKAG